MCHNVEQMPTHSHTPPHTPLPLSPSPFHYAHTPLGATELNPQESPLETFALLCPQASCTASLSLSTSLSPPLPPLRVFCIPTFLLLRPHTSHTNCASSSSSFFMFRAQWILASTRTSNTVRVPAPVPSSTQHTTTTQKSLTIKKNIYIAHAKKKQRKAVKNF